MIQGGQEYIAASYGISWAAIVLYTLSLFKRLRTARAEQTGLSMQRDAE